MAIAEQLTASRTSVRRRACALMLFALALVVGPTLVAGQTPVAPRTGVGLSTTPPIDPDEFVGPFSTWANLKRDFGARGDGIADDTAALQRALDSIGYRTYPDDNDRTRTLFIPAGIYRITHGLSLSGLHNGNIVGEDPATTIIRWDGGASGTILTLLGVSHARVERLTLDGNNQPVIGLERYWDGQTGPFPTYSRINDVTFRHLATGLSIGRPNIGDAEILIERATFIDCETRGIFVNSANSLDIFVWDSLFEDNRVGVTNEGSFGHFHVYRSLFRRSRVADALIGNTGYFGLRWNTSIDSTAFFIARNVGANGANLTFQGNTVLDPVQAPIQLGNLGPLLMLDNTVRMPAGSTNPVLAITTDLGVGYTAIGNTFSTAAALPARQQDRRIAQDNTVVPREQIAPAEPALPGTPPNRNRRVFELGRSATDVEIQAAIDAAQAFNGQRPVIFLPFGDKQVAKTLIIPAGSDVQLVGDGTFFGTTLSWFGPAGGTVLKLEGPSKATLRDLRINGNAGQRATAIQITNADQVGGRVLLSQPLSYDNTLDEVRVDRLDHTLVEIRALQMAGSVSQGYSVTALGGDLAGQGRDGGARVNIFGGTADWHATYRNARLLVTDQWSEGDVRLYLNGSGTVTVSGARIARSPALPAITVESFQGRVSLLGASLDSALRLTGDGRNTEVLALGLQFTHNNTYLERSSPNARLAFLQSTSYNQGTFFRPEVAPPDGGFVARMLEHLRGERPTTLEELPANVTDVRMYRVDTSQGLRGVLIQGEPYTPAAQVFLPLVRRAAR